MRAIFLHHFICKNQKIKITMHYNKRYKINNYEIYSKSDWKQIEPGWVYPW